MIASRPRDFIDPQWEERHGKVIRRLSWLALALIFLLAARFFKLQVLSGQEFERKAALQSSRSLVLLPERGLILDRNGHTIVGNQPGFRLRLYPDAVTNRVKTLAFLQKNLAYAPENLSERFEAAMKRRPFRPETLVDMLHRDDLARVYAHRYEFPELDIQTVPIRRYPHGDLAAHLFGYLGEINDKELERLRGIGIYAAGDIIGKQGLEEHYDRLLFGSKGFEQFRVDASGRIQELLKSQAPRPGWDLLLTLDLPTQITAESELAGKRGALVAIDPSTGGVIAIVSEPSFLPEKFIGGIKHSDWNQLRDDPGHPLEYRPVRGQYPPGSTFKMLTAIAGLAEKVIGLHDRIFCPGHYRMGRRTFRCWKAGGHGAVDLHRAIQVSCDTYFYEVSRRLGINRLAHYARLYGFGSLTGLDIAGEKPGLVPDAAWKIRTKRGPWQEGETIMVGIGQGYLLTTPLQMARFFAALANGGWLVPIHVRQEFAHTDRPAAGVPAPLPASTPVDVPLRYIQPIKDALVAVVNDPGGTGGYARIKGITVAGKTGTAQIVTQSEREQKLDTHLKDHAWFIAYAPAEQPKIVVAVLVENGGSGGAAAAPIARKVIETYLR